MNERTIVMIDRAELVPHPENPRKDLGDLEELRESIKENGLMQNLTVTPIPEDEKREGSEAKYYILIGHRRFAASEGILDELPCAIADYLTQREQVGIMLAENMQRSDLTFIEQAHGFQLMMDLGDTVESISKKTGFSKQTIKHRLEISKLDKNIIETAQKNFQLSIGDFIELEKVKDLEERNRILEKSANSEELKYEIEYYLRDQRCEENKKKYVELFNELGWKEASDRWFNFGSKWDHVSGLGYISFDDFKPDTIREAAKKLKGEIYYSNLENANSVSFARKISKKDEKTKKKTKTELREEEMKKKQSQLEAARRDICDEYLNCIISIPEEKLEDVYSIKYLVVSRIWDQLEKLEAYITDFDHIYGVKSNRKDWTLLQETYKDFDLLQRVMLNMWKALASDYQNKFVGYNHIKIEKVLEAHQELYDILRKFGFRLDPEMEAVIDGTSELYLIDGKEVTK